MQGLGMILVLTGAGWMGYRVIGEIRRQTLLLEQFCRALELMAWEVQYNQLPLGPLCRQIGQLTQADTGAIFQCLGGRLMDSEASVPEIFDRVMTQYRVPPEPRQIWMGLTGTFGRFDVQRQSQAIQGALVQMQRLADQARQAQVTRCRQVRIWSLCGGALVAILLL